MNEDLILLALKHAIRPQDEMNLLEVC